MENNLAVIQKLIQEIESYTNNYSSISEISSIEKDILLQKTREIYDLIIQSGQQAEIQNEVAKEQPIENPMEEINSSVEETTDSHEDKDAKIAELEAKLAELTQKDEVSNDIEEFGFSLNEEESSTHENQQNPKENEQQTVIPEPEKNSVEPEKENSPKQIIDLASKLGKTPITDIYSAIRFNDRVRYRADLFNKDQEYFLREVNKLNEMKSYDEALQYLQKNFSWDFENNSEVKEFLSYVERRFL